MRPSAPSGPSGPQGHVHVRTPPTAQDPGPQGLGVLGVGNPVQNLGVLAVLAPFRTLEFYELGLVQLVSVHRVQES